MQIQCVESETFVVGPLGEYTITKDPTRPDIDARRILLDCSKNGRNPVM